MTIVVLSLLKNPFLFWCAFILEGLPKLPPFLKSLDPSEVMTRGNFFVIDAARVGPLDRVVDGGLLVPRLGDGHRLVVPWLVDSAELSSAFRKRETDS